MLFLGVTTGLSAAHRHFPTWLAALGVPVGSRLEGVDVPLGAPTETYRTIVHRLRDDPDVAGALITSHKVATYAAAADLFDETDRLASLCAEVGCVSRATGRLVGHALDPVTSMAALDLLAPPSHWKAFPAARVACIGAGGAGVAIAVGLAQRIGHSSSPAGIVIADSIAGRVRHALETIRRVGTPNSWAVGIATGGDAARADDVVSALPPGSIVVNATGMGKDVPGSPVTNAVRFPEGGIAWDLNYRGARPFLDQATSQASWRGLAVVDGWDYFAVSWVLHVARVFGAPEDAATLERAVKATIRT